MAPRPRAEQRPAQLPRDTAGLTGRAAQLDRLDALLSEEVPGAGAVVVLDGTAGAGKTALAVHWAHRIRARFPDGQLYVNLLGYSAGPPLRPVEALARFLRALGVPSEQIPVDPDEAAALYRSRLAGRRLLVLLDDAVDAEHVRPLLPGTSGCLALVTSRDRLAGLVARDGARRITLGVLDPPDARLLMHRALGAQRAGADPAALDRLLRACAHLPLALRIAAAHLLDHPHTSVAEYTADLVAGNPLAALQLDDEHAAVRAAFDLSYARLDQPAQRLFRLVGLAPGVDLGAAAAAALLGAPAAEAARLLHRLAGAHLLDEHAPGRYACHDLLRRYALERAYHEESEPDRAAALLRLFHHYLHGIDTAARVLYPHMLRLPVPPSAGGDPLDAGRAGAWLDAERANLVACVAHTLQHGPHPVAWLVADGLRGYFVQRGYPVEWLATARAALAAAEAAGDRRAQTAAHFDLATYHWLQGPHPRAVEHGDRMLELAREIGWAEAEASALGILGNLHRLGGRPQPALEYLTAALTRYERIGWPSGQAVARGHLGALLAQLGRLAEAEREYGQACALHRSIGQAFAEAVTSGGLAEVQLLQGRVDDALERLARGRVLAREAASRHQEAEILRVTALARRDRGDLARAREVGEEALTLALELGYRSVEAAAAQTLARIVAPLGEHDRAIQLHRRALRIARDDGRREEETQALLGLADVHLLLDRPHAAHRYADHALSCARSGGYRVLEGDARTVLAAVSRRFGEEREAVVHARRALAIHRATGYRLGEAGTRLLLGHALRAVGDRPGALAQWRRAHAVFRAVRSPRAATVAALLDTVGSTADEPA